MSIAQRDADVIVERTSDGYLVRWVGLATLRVGTQTSFEPEEGVHPSVIDKLRRGPMLAAERYLRRTGLAFHASAVAMDGRAALFAGESGVGKSTLAAFLVRGGAQALADDVALTQVDGQSVIVEPTETVHLLDARSRSYLGLPIDAAPFAKSSVDAAAAADGPVRLHAFIEVTTGPASVVHLRGLDAMKAVGAWRMCPNTDEDARFMEDFDAIAKIASNVPVFRLYRGEHDLVAIRKLLTSTIGFRHD